MTVPEKDPPLYGRSDEQKRLARWEMPFIDAGRHLAGKLRLLQFGVDLADALHLAPRARHQLLLLRLDDSGAKTGSDPESRVNVQFVKPGKRYLRVIRVHDGLPLCMPARIHRQDDPCGGGSGAAWAQPRRGFIEDLGQLRNPCTTH